jgi:hypothetical protein
MAEDPGLNIPKDPVITFGLSSIIIPQNTADERRLILHPRCSRAAEVVRANLGVTLVPTARSLSSTDLHIVNRLLLVKAGEEWNDSRIPIWAPPLNTPEENEGARLIIPSDPATMGDRDEISLPIGGRTGSRGLGMYFGRHSPISRRSIPTGTLGLGGAAFFVTLPSFTFSPRSEGMVRPPQTSRCSSGHEGNREFGRERGEVKTM